MHDGVTEALAGFPVKTATPCEGTGYEIGSMSIIKGARNLANAKKFYDWALTPEAQKLGAQAKQFQVPSNKATPLPPEAPKFADMKLIDYDQAKYGKSAERKRLIARGTARWARCPSPDARCRARRWRGRSRACSRPWRCPGTRCRKASIPAPGSPACGRRRTTPPASRRSSSTAGGGWRRCCWRWSPASRHRLAPAVARAARHAALLIASGVGLVLFVAQALGIGLRGWTADWLTACSANWSRQVGIGAGGALVLIALLALLSIGLALRGAFGGDAFVAGAVTTVAASILLFTAWPILRILVQAFQDGDGAFMPALLLERLATEKIWSLRCLSGGGRCGVAWNTLFLALGCGAGTTALGLAFALIVTRTSFAFKKTLRVLTVLPIITPPFVIGLALILVFGRSGLVNQFLEWSMGIAARRAGSTASRACFWRSSSPSRRSPSWC